MEKLNGIETEINDREFDFVLKLLDKIDNIRRISSHEILHNKPSRCRVLLFNNDDSSVALMGRKRNNETYTVLPGGGVEENDNDAISAISRELEEEFSIDPLDVNFYTGQALELEPDVWVFLAKTKRPDVKLILSGPEVERNGTLERGYYYPKWLPLEQVFSENIVPTDFKNKIVSALKRINDKNT